VSAGLAPGRACARLEWLGYQLLPQTKNTLRCVRPLKLLYKICLPVQFLNLRVEFAVAPRQLVGPLLQVGDWQRRDEFHLRLRVAVLARGSGFGQCGKMVPLLTSEVAFGDAVGDVESPIQLRARIGAVDSLYQFKQAGVETVEFGQQRNRIFGGAARPPARAQSAPTACLPRRYDSDNHCVRQVLRLVSKTRLLAQLYFLR